MRLEDAKKDHYRKLAKELGYRSRSAFKLIELNKKYNLIKSNDNILDFGAAPGGWLQVSSKLVMPKGKVIGVDLLPIMPVEENVTIFQGDIREKEVIERILHEGKGKVDVVLSDMATNISGIWKIDHNNQIDLTMLIIDRFPELLEKNGSCLLKAFDGPRLKSLENNLKKNFKNVKLIKPKVSRNASSELYIFCRGFR
ncbi:MAG: RlmE family RNA methyltransferase [Thaumarchaeota archaeon]|nr:RlmE family RNA methyltransferase [Nitrososphaerales archaeon]NSL73926.1 RlmE family RNA methyltransferase [Nitrososphaerota archaeon]NSL75631.1 RlmE family RNA methyltransferase [Nitrososphaerota archaeon]NSL77067.1 RlmE family RNA methyltransferase [Nitrososphaerota archaeon]